MEVVNRRNKFSEMGIRLVIYLIVFGVGYPIVKDLSRSTKISNAEEPLFTILYLIFALLVVGLHFFLFWGWTRIVFDDEEKVVYLYIFNSLGLERTVSLKYDEVRYKFSPRYKGVIIGKGKKRIIEVTDEKRYEAIKKKLDEIGAKKLNRLLDY